VSLYLDASAIVPILFAEPSSAALDSYLSATTERLVVGDLAAVEVGSAVGRLVRMGLLTRDGAAAVFEEFDAWRATATVGVDIQSADFGLAILFVRHFELGLRAPDALHVAVCRRDGHRLVTLDRRLVAAARALGVEVDCPG
jgi:hypothetical protein